MPPSALLAVLDLRVFSVWCKLRIRLEPAGISKMRCCVRSIQCIGTMSFGSRDNQ